MDQSESSRLGWFPPTSWTLVRHAAVDSPDALERICETYWAPVYSYIRYRGSSAEDAEDLTQSFFARALEDGWFRQAQRGRGRFRAFLQASVRHFLANEWDKATALKRGGGFTTTSLDDGAEECAARAEVFEDVTPEVIFDRQWALTLLEAALGRVREEYQARGQAQIFDSLKPFLVSEQGRGAYEELEQSLGIGVGALRVAVHRLRRRYGELLRAEIAATLTDPAEVDEEIRYLLAAVAGP